MLMPPSRRHCNQVRPASSLDYRPLVPEAILCMVAGLLRHLAALNRAQERCSAFTNTCVNAVRMNPCGFRAL